MYRFPKFVTEMRSLQAGANGSSGTRSILSSSGDFDGALPFFVVLRGGWEEPSRDYQFTTLGSRLDGYRLPRLTSTAVFDGCHDENRLALVGAITMTVGASFAYRSFVSCVVANIAS